MLFQIRKYLSSNKFKIIDKFIWKITKIKEIETKKLTLYIKYYLNFLYIH